MSEFLSYIQKNKKFKTVALTKGNHILFENTSNDSFSIFNFHAKGKGILYAGDSEGNRMDIFIIDGKFDWDDITSIKLWNGASLLFDATEPSTVMCSYVKNNLGKSWGVFTRECVTKPIEEEVKVKERKKTKNKVYGMPGHKTV